MPPPLSNSGREVTYSLRRGNMRVSRAAPPVDAHSLDPPSMEVWGFLRAWRPIDEELRPARAATSASSRLNTTSISEAPGSARPDLKSVAH